MGHATYQRIHGGVISAALDAMAGIAVMSAISAKHMDEPPMKRAERFAKLGTIDLRVDYTRPGIGERFSVRAEVLRLGLARGHHAHGVSERTRGSAGSGHGGLHHVLIRFL